MTVSTHIIETKLPFDSDSIRTDIVFIASWDHPGWLPEIELIDVLPLGIVPPIEPAALRKLARDWLDNGGYDACCNLAEEKKGEG
jgi:hypothetical protein